MVCASNFRYYWVDFSVTDNSAGEMKMVDTKSPQTCNTGRGLSCEAVRSNSSGAVCYQWDVAPELF